ncbi:ElyC/SanA/YdcF family protein [Aeromonas dhakensis]|uniref:ElyC/SanA/YdcF family protein n=1 Tax=Aeromonas dhakensis TaxID=196024 RepID=UPI003BA2F697
MVLEWPGAINLRWNAIMMKRTAIALTLAGLLTLPAVLPSEAWATPVRSLQKEQNYDQYISKRQVVDQLLADAWQIFKSPARISTAGFTAKMPSNMEQVTELLLQAYQLEPYRTDLLISAANAQIYNGNVDKAIGLFEQALSTAPDDIDLLTYLATWQTFKHNETAAKGYQSKLATLNPGRAADLQRIFDTVERVIATPLKEQGERSPKPGNRAIVTLGYALNPDGSMHDILLGRLETTRALAKANPATLIILTGGVPQNRQTEGKLMADWLVKKGIDRSRIIEENYATSTVENALYSGYALARHQIEYATLVSSASHVRRGQTLLEIACWQSGPAGIRIDSVSYPDKPLSELAKVSDSELLGIYRDALRTYGLWSYRSAPLLER